MEWDIHTKPPSDFCPGRYCFRWVPVGGMAQMSGRSYNSVREAVADRNGWVAFPEGGCGCSDGVCTRLDPVNGDRDWYESETLALEQDGLPWFYFIASAELLGPHCRDEYLRESRALWGGNSTDA